jgi:hypothetical protein
MSQAINEISTQHLRRDDGEVIDTRPNWQQWSDACARSNRANTVGILGSLIRDALRQDGGQQ